MDKALRPGLTIIKTLVWNKVPSDYGGKGSECELTFNDGSTLTYDCRNVAELKDKNSGIYELQDDGTYIQIEDWEE